MRCGAFWRRHFTRAVESWSNCGTGEDAFFLGGHGVSVARGSASAEMVAVGESRLLAESLVAAIEFRQLPAGNRAPQACP